MVSVEKNLALLEFLTGEHAGTCLQLRVGKYTIGSNDDCDLVIFDGIFRGKRIKLDIREFAIILDCDDPDFLTIDDKHPQAKRTIIGSGQKISAGTTSFKLVFWDEEAKAQTVKNEPEPAPKAQTSPSTCDTEKAIAQEVGPINPEAKTKIRIKPAIYKKTALIAAIIISICGVAGLIETRARIEPPVNEGDIENTLKKLGVTGLISKKDKTGIITYEGYVSTSAVKEQVFGKLGNGLTKAIIKIHSDQEIKHSAENLLRLHGIEFAFVYNGNGKADLRGFSMDTVSAIRSIETLKADLPALRSISNMAMSSDDVFRIMGSLLTSSGLNKRIRFTIEKGELFAIGNPDSSQKVEWRAIAGDFEKKHFVAIKEKWTDSPPWGLSALEKNRLLGDNVYTGNIDGVNYISRGKNEKLFEGARLKSGHIIKKIEPGRVVLEINGAQTSYAIQGAKK